MKVVSASDLTTLILLRHGETVWNAEGRLMNQLDAPLSALGREQAEKLATRMSGVRFDALYSSDLDRALATSQAIANRWGAAINALSGLREMNLGAFAGLTWPQVEKEFPEELARYRKEEDYAVPLGESRRVFHDRTMSCLKALVDQHPGQTLAVVAHGGTLGTVLRELMSLPLTCPLPARLPNASFNQFDIQDGIWRLRTWGDTNHLD